MILFQVGELFLYTHVYLLCIYIYTCVCVYIHGVYNHERDGGQYFMFTFVIWPLRTWGHRSLEKLVIFAILYRRTNFRSLTAQQHMGETGTWKSGSSWSSYLGPKEVTLKKATLEISNPCLDTPLIIALDLLLSHWPSPWTWNILLYHLLYIICTQDI